MKEKIPQRPGGAHFQDIPLIDRLIEIAPLRTDSDRARGHRDIVGDREAVRLAEGPVVTDGERWKPGGDLHPLLPFNGPGEIEVLVSQGRTGDFGKGRFVGQKA